MKKLVKKIKNLYFRIKKDPDAAAFSSLLKKYFKAKNLNKKSPIILMELNSMASAHISYAYLSQSLSRKYRAQIQAYSPNLISDYKVMMLFTLDKILNLYPFNIYKSFGCNYFIRVKISEKIIKIADRIFDKYYCNMTSKKDIEKTTINGVLIGDLIYDSYLRECKKPTLDLSDYEFQKFYKKSLQIFVFWEEIFNKCDICAINVSHCVYNMAIPMRIAVSRGIPAYQSSATHIYRLTSNHLFAYDDFKYFNTNFKKLPRITRDAGIEEAKNRLKRRFSGEVGVDMRYSKKSAFTSKKYTRLLRESNNIKILIAAHCFFDSPHSYGNNLFSDFYEWIDFLGKLSMTTNYDWYIKTHPDYLPETKKIIESFIVKYPKFTLLPSDTSHHQIIEEGINVALTVYGTIGFEYAALGIPVVNASLCNPHIAYSFNVHPESILAYKNILLNIKELELKINKEEILEYYYMANIYNTENLFYDDYDKSIQDIGGYSEQFHPKFYRYWIKYFNLIKHESIQIALERFINSNDFRMDYSHFGEAIKD